MTDTDILQLHDAAYTQNRSAFLANAKSGIIDQYDPLSYVVHGLLSMAEATGEISRLDRAIELLSAAYNLAKTLTSPKNRTLHYWGPLISGKPNQLLHFKFAAAMARAAAMIRKNPTWNQPYSALADRYARLAREVTVSYWIEDVYGGQVPWLTQANGGWGSYQLWQDRTGHLGACCSDLYPATGETGLREIARKITTDFKGKWKDDGKGGVVWDLGVSLTEWKAESFQNAHAAQDTSHSNSEPKMMVAGLEAGIPGIVATDLSRMAEHVCRVMWNQSLTDPSISNYIDGNNSPFINISAPGGIGNLYAGWIMLGRYHSGIQSVGEAILSCMIGGHHNACIDYNAGPEGRIALSGHLLRNRRLSATTANSLVITRARTEIPGGNTLLNLSASSSTGIAVFSLVPLSAPLTLGTGGNIPGGPFVVPVGRRAICFYDGKECHVLSV